jgi:hypothetical protein
MLMWCCAAALKALLGTDADTKPSQAKHRGTRTHDAKLRS